jgi:hypothetical protein
MMIANSTAATIATNNGSYTEYVLAELKCAGLRARLQVAEIVTIDAALRGKFIDADAAIEWANEIGALGFMSATITFTRST